MTPTTIVSLLVLLLAAAAVACLMWMLSWDISKDAFSYQHKVRLTFSDFVKYYYIDPRKYELEGSNPIYKDSGVEYALVFGPVDYLRYRRFRIKRLHRADDDMTRRSSINYLQAVQNDIDKKRKQAEREIREAEEHLQKSMVRNEK